MSIWSTIGDHVRAKDADFGESNFRAEGEDRFDVGLARTGWHDHLRLTVQDDVATPYRGPVDIAVLLSPTAARALRDALTEGLGQ